MHRRLEFKCCFFILSYIFHLIKFLTRRTAFRNGSLEASQKLNENRTQRQKILMEVIENSKMIVMQFCIHHYCTPQLIQSNQMISNGVGNRVYNLVFDFLTQRCKYRLLRMKENDYSVQIN